MNRDMQPCKVTRYERGMQVSNQLNSLYVKFLKRNPRYNGKVSTYGHFWVVFFPMIFFAINRTYLLSNSSPLKIVIKAQSIMMTHLTGETTESVPTGFPMISMKKEEADTVDSPSRNFRCSTKRLQ